MTGTRDKLLLILEALEHSTPKMGHYSEPCARHSAAVCAVISLLASDVLDTNMPAPLDTLDAAELQARDGARNNTQRSSALCSVASTGRKARGEVTCA